jgi:hypothetical protein
MAKVLTKVRLIGKPTLHGDIAERRIASQHEYTRQLNPAVHDVCMRGTPECSLKYAGEIGHAEPCYSPQVDRQQLRIEIGLDIFT